MIRVPFILLLCVCAHVYGCMCMYVCVHESVEVTSHLCFYLCADVRVLLYIHVCVPVQEPEVATEGLPQLFFT